MLKKIFSIMLTIFLSLCLSTIYAATPKYSADKSILAYAEMYTYGTSENSIATGIPKEYTDEIQKRMQNHLMLSFKNYPLNPENFETVKVKLVERLHEVIKISTRLKVDDEKNPVVEVTANHDDQKAVDALKEKDGEFKTLDVMRHISEPLELATDGQFQDIALKSILGLIAELPVKDDTTFDVPCMLIEDNGEAYWMPQDVEALSKFVDPVFKLKEPDPEAIDNLLVQIFGGMPAGENSTEG